MVRPLWIERIGAWYHYHLILELTELNLSRAGQWFNGSYVTWFNRRHARCGHLFQGRFKAVIVSPEEWGLEVEPLPPS